MGSIEYGNIGVAILAKTVVNSRPLSLESEHFLGIVLITLNDGPAHNMSGFFVGRVCLQKQTLLARRK